MEPYWNVVWVQKLKQRITTFYIILIWTFAPKLIHARNRTIELASFLAACIFIESFKPILKMLSVKGIRIGPKAHASSVRQDDDRIVSSALNFKLHRHQRKAGRQEGRKAGRKNFGESEFWSKERFFEWNRDRRLKIRKYAVRIENILWIKLPKTSLEALNVFFSKLLYRVGVKKIKFLNFTIQKNLELAVKAS